MKETRYTAEASNEAGQKIEAGGFRNGGEAQRWALEVMPNANRLILRTAQGQSRGWYSREAGTGEWKDDDMWGKSV